MTEGLSSLLQWQRARRRRSACGHRPETHDPFWRHFFDGTEAVAGFDEPRALQALLLADPLCPHDGPVRAALDETLGEVRFLLNDYGLALEAFRRAQIGWAALRQPLFEAEARGWWGASLVQQGRYRDGYEQLHAAIDACAAAGHAPRAARALNYLAIIHEELGDLPRALEVYARAEQAAVDDGDADMLGRVLANSGEAWVTQGQPDRGLPVLSRAVDVLRSVGAHWHYGWCLLAIGRIHHERGDAAKALEFHHAAQQAVERGHSPRACVEVYAGLGSLLSQLQRHDDALPWLHRALALAEQIGVRREVFKTHKLLADAFKRAGHYRLALEHHEQFHEVRAEVFDALARERVATLRAEFELEHVRAAYAQLEARTETLVHLSARDGLTGLFNRRRFDELLAVEVARAERFEHPLSLLVLDIDHFKRINDTFSHVVGDSVLQTIAQLLQREIRAADFAARFGGEEFVLLLPQTSLEGARIVAEKVRLAIATTAWAHLTPGHHVTTSIGLAQWKPTEGPLELLRRADLALYEAKRAGRNRVRGN